MFEFNFEHAALSLRVVGTIISKIYLAVIGYTLYVTGVAALHVHVLHLALASTIISAVGILISLIVAFRTNSAYSRYEESSKLLAQMKITVRTIARTIWIFAPTKTSRELLIKKSMINLLDGFSFSVKHHLRHEYSDDEKDMKPYVKHIQHFELRMPQKPGEKVTAEVDPYLACSLLPPTNLPKEILFQLTLYARAILEKYPNVNPAILHGVTTGGINKLENILSELETLRQTPTPVCYVAHLKHIVWIYLLILPFQVLNSLGWWVSLALAIVGFVFEGCLAISKQMEEPFGSSMNDLPQDDYCWSIRKELVQITSTIPEDFDRWACSERNLPLKPGCTLTGKEWSTETLNEARTILQSLNFVPKSNKRNRDSWKKRSQKKRYSEGQNQNGAANV